MNHDEEAQRREDAAVDRTVGAVGGVILGALATATFGPAGAAVVPTLSAGAAPWIEEMSYLARTAIARRSGRAQQAIAIASETANIEPIQLLQSLLINDKLIEMTARVIEAAASSTLEAKIAVLGRALGQAADDPTRVDVELLIIDALSSLESSHIRLLAALAARAPHPMNQAPAVHISSGGTTSQPNDSLWTTWTDELLEQQHPYFKGTTVVLASRLTSIGLLTRQNPWFSGETMRVNEFGRSLLEKLRKEGLTEKQLG